MPNADATQQGTQDQALDLAGQVQDLDYSEEVTDDFAEVQDPGAKSSETTTEQRPADDQIPADHSGDAEGAEAPASTEGALPDSTLPQVSTEQAEGFPDDLLRVSGLTAEQARQQFGNSQVMETAMRWHAQQLAARGRQSMSQMQSQAQAPVQPVATQQQQVPPTNIPVGPRLAMGHPAIARPSGSQQAAQAPLFQPFAPLIPKDADGDPLYDDATVKLIEAMDKHYGTQFERFGRPALEAHAAAQQFYEQQQQQAVESYVAKMDSLFGSLGDEWKDTFGAGAGREIVRSDPNSPLIANRSRLDDTMRAIRQGRAMEGLPELDTETLFNQALRVEFNDKITKVGLGKAVAKVAGRRGVYTNRPTSRKTPQVSQDEKTVSAVDAVLRKRGRSLDYGPQDEAFDGEI